MRTSRQASGRVNHHAAALIFPLRNGEWVGGKGRDGPLCPHRAPTQTLKSPWLDVTLQLHPHHHLTLSALAHHRLSLKCSPALCRSTTHKHTLTHYLLHILAEHPYKYTNRYSQIHTSPYSLSAN